MISVSNEWKTAHDELLLPETFITITYGVSDPGIENDANVTGSVSESFSEMSDIVNALDKNPERYATLELNEWGLDGTFEYFDGTPVDAGYTTSVLSTKDAEYGSSVPTVTIAFSSARVNPIPGVTITWGSSIDEYATSFTVTAYNGTTEIAKETITNNTDVVSRITMDLQNYDKIVIQVLKWCLPYRRCRITEVYLGFKEIYTKNDLLGYEHSESADLLSATLPKSAISFGLDNSNGRWNPNNPTGMERYLLERQKLDVRYGMMVDGVSEWIKAGTFWLSEWNTPTNGIEASFSARDALDFMNEVYTGTRAGTLYDIATEAFEQANLPLANHGKRYYVSENLREMTTDFTEEQTSYTILDVLQTIAHMACCVFYQNRAGIVCIEPHNDTQTDYVINTFRSYTHPEIDISKPLKAVSVSYGDGQETTVVVGTSGEVQTVSNEFIKTSDDAQKVANRTADVLKGRKTISGEYRADPRLCVLDVVTVESKYANNKVAITDVKYTTTGGALKGTYTGRIMG